MVSRLLGGSCQVPLAAHATIDGATMLVRALVAMPDGSFSASAEASGPASEAEALGRQVVELLRARGAADILAKCQPGHGSDA